MTCKYVFNKNMKQKRMLPSPFSRFSLRDHTPCARWQRTSHPPIRPSAHRQVIAYMTLGIDVSPLFSEMVMAGRLGRSL